MRYFIGAILIMGVLGAFLAPPYSYTPEEQARLKTRERSMLDYVAWPARAYENWRKCGTIRYCRVTRCAALDGGCTPPPKKTPWEFTLRAPTRNQGETATAWQGRVDAWCEGKKKDYELWVYRRKSAEAAEKCKPQATKLPENSLSLTGEPKQVAPKPTAPKDARDIKIDTSNLIDCSILHSQPVYISEYEAHCR